MQPIKIGTEGKDGRPLYLTRSDLKAHAHSIGASRKGKSKLIEWIVRQFVKNEQGFCVIDPNGFLYYDILQWLTYIQPKRNKTVLFNPSYDKKVVGFNPFRTEGAKDETAIMAQVERMIASTMKALGARSISSMPRMERVLRCLYYVLIEQDLSIDSLRFFLSKRHFHMRDEIITRCKSETVRDAFDMLTEDKSDNQYLTTIESAASRILRIVTNQTIKRTCGLQTNNINVKEIVDSNTILLANMQSTFSFSESSARVLGTLLVSEIWETMRQRARSDVSKLPKFFLIMDEFQTFITPDISSMLDQSAKYGLHLMLFHQNVDQLDPVLKTAVTACHTKFVFGGVKTNDAAFMLEGSKPSFEAEDLQEDVRTVSGQPAQHFVLKRPEQRLEHAYAPFVHDYPQRPESIDKYVEELTKDYLTPQEVDEELAKINSSLETINTSSPDAEGADQSSAVLEPENQGREGETFKEDTPGEVFDPYHS